MLVGAYERFIVDGDVQFFPLFYVRQKMAGDFNVLVLFGYKFHNSIGYLLNTHAQILEFHESISFTLMAFFGLDSSLGSTTVKMPFLMVASIFLTSTSAGRIMERENAPQ